MRNALGVAAVALLLWANVGVARSPATVVQPQERAKGGSGSTLPERKQVVRTFAVALTPGERDGAAPASAAPARWSSVLTVVQRKVALGARVVTLGRRLDELGHVVADRLRGHPDLKGIAAALAELPEFAPQRAVIDRMGERGELMLAYENRFSDPVFRPAANERGRNVVGSSTRAVVIAQRPLATRRKREGHRAGDVLLTLAHELTHAAQPELLGALLLDAFDRLPRDLVSRTPSDIAGTVYHLPQGLFVDQTFWRWLGEANAYDMERRLYHGEKSGLFQGPAARFPVAAPAPAPLGAGVPRASLVRYLTALGFDDAQLAKVVIPDQVSPTHAYVLGFYGPHGTGELKLDAPHFGKYMFMGRAEVLDGALLPGPALAAIP